MNKLSIRDKTLSCRADEQLPLPFGPAEERNNALELARSSPIEYFAKGYGVNTNYDDITKFVLENASIHTYRQLIHNKYLDAPKFNSYNLKYLQSELLDDPATFLQDDWHEIEKIIPDTPERAKIIDDVFRGILESNISAFFDAADAWNTPISMELIDKARDIAIEIAEEDPEAYFEKYWLHHVEKLHEITNDAADILASKYPKKYLEMLGGNYWDDFMYRHLSFEKMSFRLADIDPAEFFTELYDNQQEYRDNELIIPTEAVVKAGTWMAENNPEQYIELGLNDIPELNDATRALGLAGATLPKILVEAGYKYAVDSSENNFMSIYTSNYPDQQRHPEASGLDRFDVALSWPPDDTARKMQRVVADDYSSYVHDVGNVSGTKSFALVAPDIKNQALLIEEIQSDFPMILHNMKRDNFFKRAAREGVKEEEYNDFVKRMSEHMAAYPYLMIQRLAEFADQNENIDELKLSSLSAIMRMAGITNKKKAQRVYKDIPNGLGFDVKDEYVPPLSINKFIDNEREPLTETAIKAFYNRVLYGTDDELKDVFKTNNYPPGVEEALKFTAERLATNYPDLYIKLNLHEIKEFLPYTKSLDTDTYRFFETWSIYDGDMKELAQRAATGAAQAIERLYEGAAKKPKPVSKREKKVRRLDISKLKPEIEKIIGDRANQIEFSEDVGAFMRSVGRLQRDKLITNKEKNQITGLINRYVRAFLDILITKVADMYGVETTLSKRATIDDFNGVCGGC